MLKVLDLYCGEGGASMGYHKVLEELGIEHTITGIDNNHKCAHLYPFKFFCADALQYAKHGREFDFIHASPVCKGYSRLAALWKDRKYPDDIAPIRELLQISGKPYVIENVVGAPLSGVMLCGSMFGLKVYRHRIFETNPTILLAPASCNHYGRASGTKPLKKSARLSALKNFDFITVTGHSFVLSDARIATGNYWMSQSGIAQSIPWIYTYWIGLQIFGRKDQITCP